MSDELDPEDLPEYCSPAWVHFADSSLLVADHAILDTGWLRVRCWDDTVRKFPPQQVDSVESVATDSYRRDGAPLDAPQSQRLVDDDLRQRARASTESERRPQVMADD